MRAKLLPNEMLEQLKVSFEWSAHSEKGFAKAEYMQALKEVQDELKVRKNDEETRQKYLAARSGLG